MPSESPFERLGRLTSRPRAEKRVRLYGGKYENAFTVAHRAFGEWRAWRDLCENNDVLDPLDLRASELEADGAFVIEDGLVNLTTRLGVELDIIAASETFPEGAEIVIDGVSETQYNIFIRIDGADGPPTTLSFATISQGGEQTTRALGPNGEFLDLRYDGDAFLVAWLMRCVPVAARSRPTVYELVAPALILGTSALGEV